MVETMAPTAMIQDYAVIGNGRSAALVSRYRSIDWLSWPTFHSPSLFGAILDQRTGGAWSITPNEPARCQRSYIDRTTVLQTHFHTASGMVYLTGFMPAMSEEEKRRFLLPEHELVQRIEGVQGQVEMLVHFDARPYYGRSKITMRDAKRSRSFLPPAR